MRPCETCTGECCKAYFVSLSGHDVWTIATGLQLSPEQFVNVAQEHEATGIGFKLDSTKTTFSMVLAKYPGPDGRQQCTFLMNLNDGSGRCGIYALRPSACRVFPAQLRGSDVVFRDEIVCPPGSWNAGGLDAQPWRKSLLRSRMEWAIYTTVVYHWNEQAVRTPRGEMRTPNDYYSYLLDRYERLAQLERSLEPPELDAMLSRWGQRDTAALGEAPWERYLTRAEAAIAAQ